MNNRPTINDVPIEFRVPLIGGHNLLLNWCPYCDENKEFEYAIPIGFSEYNGDLVFVQECNICFEKSFFHIKNYDSLNTFLIKNKFYKYNET